LLALLGGWAGRWDGVAGRTAEARSLFAAMGDRAMEAEGLTLSAWGEVMLGRPQEALRFGRERLAATRELGDQDIHLADSHGLVVALLELGEYEEALCVARRAVEAARSLGSPPRLFISLLLLGDAERALFRLDRARAAYREMAGVVVIPQYRALVHSKLCAVSSLAGDWEEAHAWALRAVEARGEVALQLSETLHRQDEIEALLRGGDGDLARREMERFGERVGDNRRLRVSHLSALAVLAKWDGDPSGAAEHLRAAESLCDEIGLPGELWRVRAELGEIHEVRGELEEARRAFAGAAGVLQELAARIGDEGLQAGFLAAPQVGRVVERAAPTAGQEAPERRSPG
jgi:tetratricopeptide (TPR) repeat protein